MMNLLLQVLDEGRLTDSHGKLIDFKNTVLILTSNLGYQHFEAETDKKNVHEKVIKELKNTFRPEFLNRIDETIIFESLSNDNLIEITNIQLGKLIKRIKVHQKNIQLNKYLMSLKML